MIHAIKYQLPEELEGTPLEGIIHAKLHELTGAKERWPAAAIEAVLDRAPAIRSFKSALLRRAPAVIAEIKRASPSLGLLRQDFDPVAIAREYRKSGAAAISVVTEVQHFRGGLEHLARLRWACDLPLLRKDFIIDSYQIPESRHAGADAVLLIAALLDDATLKDLRLAIENHGMDALVEVHSVEELERALAAGATLIGVNARDLRTFEVSPEVCVKLAARLPKDVIAVAESGIRTAKDLRRLADAGYRGFLVGEQLMRAPSPGAALAQLLGGAASARRAS